MTELCPFNVHAPKWHVVYFVPIDGQIVRYGLQMAILVIVWSIFWDKMAILGLIDFKIGLNIEVNVNVGQNKFEVQCYHGKYFTMNVWTQNYPQNVWTCPSLPLHHLALNPFFQSDRPEPPLSKFFILSSLFELKYSTGFNNLIMDKNIYIYYVLSIDYM